jgi:hypothetical protein
MRSELSLRSLARLRPAKDAESPTPVAQNQSRGSHLPRQPTPARPGGYGGVNGGLSGANAEPVDFARIKALMSSPLLEQNAANDMQSRVSLLIKFHGQVISIFS